MDDRLENCLSMGIQPSTTLSSLSELWRRGCAVPTFCDFKILRLPEPKMQTFCESKILGFDNVMIQ